MTLYRNLSGTTQTAFSFGIGGPTIHQGSTVPDSGLGLDGDLYARSGTAELYSKVDGDWFDIITNTGSRVTTYRGIDLTVSSSGTVVAILRNPYTCDSLDVTVDTTLFTMDNNPAASTEIILPDGPEGRDIVIKDETANATTYSVVVSASADIDGEADLTINTALGFIELVYAGSGWRVVG